MSISVLTALVLALVPTGAATTDLDDASDASADPICLSAATLCVCVALFPDCTETLLGWDCYVTVGPNPDLMIGVGCVPPS